MVITSDCLSEDKGSIPFRIARNIKIGKKSIGEADRQIKCTLLYRIMKWVAEKGSLPLFNISIWLLRLTGLGQDPFKVQMGVQASQGSLHSNCKYYE